MIQKIAQNQCAMYICGYLFSENEDTHGRQSEARTEESELVNGGTHLFKPCQSGTCNEFTKIETICHAYIAVVLGSIREAFTLLGNSVV